MQVTKIYFTPACILYTPNDIYLIIFFGPLFHLGKNYTIVIEMILFAMSI